MGWYFWLNPIQLRHSFGPHGDDLAKTIRSRIERRATRRDRREERRSESVIVAGLTPLVEMVGPGRPILMLDTDIYIDEAAGRLPVPVSAAIDRAQLFHCSICLGELALGVGGVSPLARGYKALREHYRQLAQIIPPSRVLTPDDDISTEAEVLTSTVTSGLRLTREKRRAWLNDVLVYLTAAKAGVTVLTSNKIAFGRIHLASGKGRCVYY